MHAELKKAYLEGCPMSPKLPKIWPRFFVFFDSLCVDKTDTAHQGSGPPTTEKRKVISSNVISY